LEGDFFHLSPILAFAWIKAQHALTYIVLPVHQNSPCQQCGGGNNLFGQFCAFGQKTLPNGGIPL
jgi:hypothetical protein